jgi:hypothetical protein
MMVRNGFNRGGFRGIEHPLTGASRAIPVDPSLVTWDGDYSSFCNLAESCGCHEQCSEYCTAAIGADKLTEIRGILDPK